MTQPTEGEPRRRARKKEIRDIPEADVRPIPEIGIHSEILLEYAVIPQTFRLGAVRRMGNVNFDLLTLCLSIARTSSDFHKSIEWSLIYHDIYARSAERQKSPMLKVSKELVSSTMSEMRQAHIEAEVEKKEEEQDIIEEEEKFQRALCESNSNPELHLFWTELYVYRSRQRASGNYVDDILEGVFRMSLFFERQESANRLSRDLGGI